MKIEYIVVVDVAEVPGEPFDKAHIVQRGEHEVHLGLMHYGIPVYSVEGR